MKENVEKTLKLMLDTINNLSEEEVEKLISGEATLQYKELSTQIHPYEEIREKIHKAQDFNEVELLFKAYTKKSLISICRYFQIPTKSTDTKAALTNKIVAHFNESTVKIPEESTDFQAIQQHLEQMETIKEGKTFITNHSTLKTKVNLIKLAKSLNVYVDPNNKKKEIQSRIVESIVGARLRGKGIRER